jgi:uncharacterized protein
MPRTTRSLLSEIKVVFEEEMERAGGTVAEVFEDAEHLFLRGLLPHVQDAAPGERATAGVVLRATHDTVQIHPGLFYSALGHGAILVRSLESESLHADKREPLERLETAVGLAIQRCAEESLFLDALAQLKLAQQDVEDVYQRLIPMLGTMEGEGATALLTEILDRWTSGSDPSRYGLMHAIIAEARRLVDPELRWQLETLGGLIGIVLPTELAAPGESQPAVSNAVRRELQRLVQVLGDVEAAAVITTGGDILLSTLDERALADSARLFASAQRMVRGLRDESVEQVFIRSSSMLVLLTPVDENHVLTALANSRAKLGLIFNEMKYSALELKKSLSKG